MIGLKRQAEPSALAREGQAARDELEAAFAAAPDLFATRRPKSIFRSAVYASPDVKTCLIAQQNGKCAYCESEIRHVSRGDVDHFRPKAGFHAARERKLKRPGYFWLAYRWDNLLFAFEICNRTGKRNLFPLEDEAARATHSSRDASRERPLLLNPYADRLDDHLAFHGEIAKGKSRAGDVSVEAYGLNRDELRDRRRRVLARARMLGEIAASNLSMAGQAKVLLARDRSAEGEYSAMLNGNL